MKVGFKKGIGIELYPESGEEKHALKKWCAGGYVPVIVGWFGEWGGEYENGNVSHKFLGIRFVYQGG